MDILVAVEVSMLWCWHLPHQHWAGAYDGEGNRPEADTGNGCMRGEKLMRNNRDGVNGLNLGHQAWNQTDWHSIASQLGSLGLQPGLSCSGVAA